MKILAFSDVHLGNYRYPIREYIILALEQILAIAEEERPDVVVFAGDAFRTKVPSAQDLGTFGSFLSRMGAIAPVIMIPGNHDTIGNYSVTTLDVYANYDNVFLYKEPQYLDDGGRQWIFVPWLPSKALSSFGLEGEDTAGLQRALMQLLKAKLKPDKPAFLVAHVTALGMEYHDGARTILGDDVLWTNDMFDGFDFCILGHIHNPQEVTPNAYYTGSICPVSFNEAGQEKRVIIWSHHAHSIPLDTVRFGTMDARLCSENTHVEGPAFLRIIKPHDAPDPIVPPCRWHEVVSLPPEREIRLRVPESGMSTEEAIMAWLELENVDDEKAKAVLALAREIVDG